MFPLVSVEILLTVGIMLNSKKLGPGRATEKFVFYRDGCCLGRYILHQHYNYVAKKQAQMLIHIERVTFAVFMM